MLKLSLDLFWTMVILIDGLASFIGHSKRNDTIVAPTPSFPRVNPGDFFASASFVSFSLLRFHQLTSTLFCCLFVCLSVCLFVCLSVCLFVCLCCLCCVVVVRLSLSLPTNRSSLMAFHMLQIRHNFVLKCRIILMCGSLFFLLLVHVLFNFVKRGSLCLLYVFYCSCSRNIQAIQGLHSLCSSAAIFRPCSWGICCCYIIFLFVVRFDISLFPSKSFFSPALDCAIV